MFSCHRNNEVKTTWRITQHRNIRSNEFTILSAVTFIHMSAYFLLLDCCCFAFVCKTRSLYTYIYPHSQFIQCIKAYMYPHTLYIRTYKLKTIASRTGKCKVIAKHSVQWIYVSNTGHIHSPVNLLHPTRLFLLLVRVQNKLPAYMYIYTHHS